MAREIGFAGPDYTQPCSLTAPAPAGADGVVVDVDCRARILGRWVSTDSFRWVLSVVRYPRSRGSRRARSMYVKSTAVALQALGIISIGTLADSGYWRKRLLGTFAATGSLAAALFLALPGTPHGWLPAVAALITLVGNVCYAASIVCANAFLPGLAREDPQVVAARDEAEAAERAHDEGAAGEVRESVDEEARALLPDASGDAASERATTRYAALLSTTMSRLSSTGTAIGFFSGWAMLLLLLIPVTLGGGKTRSLELALGLCGLWWGVFSIPAIIGLPGGRKEDAPHHWLRRAWARVGGMVRPSEMRELPNLFTYLLAWVFLSDGELKEDK